MAAKLEWYLTDTLLTSKDSVLSIISSNPGYFSDADIQKVFAYMDLGDFTHAATTATALGGSRADWKALLLKLIEIHQEPEGIFSVNTHTAYKSFLQDYADTDGKDGRGVAQANLKFVCDIDYSEPRPLPEEESEERTMHGSTEGTAIQLEMANGVMIFPNPTQHKVNLIYKSENESVIYAELKDLLGKTIYANFINAGKQEQISLEGYSNGIYILSLTKGRELIYTTKLVKQE